MRPGAGTSWGIGLVVLSLTGCAGAWKQARMARGESMCVHCNCLMPAGIDPEAMCPVCKCGKRARECVRGQ
jgi:hypothetical protein